MNFGRNRQPLTRAEQLRRKRQQTAVQKRPLAERKPAPRSAVPGSSPANRTSSHVPPAVNQGAAHVPPAMTRNTAHVPPAVTRNTTHVPPASSRSVAHVSPVVSRSIRYGTPLRQTVDAQPRRKVVYAVGANGVETRLPSLPIIRFNWQWVSGVLTLGCILLALLLANLSIFKVSVINTEGLQRVTPADLQGVIPQNASSIFTFDQTKALKAVIVAFPELTNIHLRISLPNGITVSAAERQPIMAWKAGDQVYWIDAEGVVMPARGDAGQLLTVESSGVLPLSRPARQINNVVDYARMVIESKTASFDPQESINYFDPAVLKAAVEMSTLMPAGATLVYDSISGMGWNDPGGWKVYFGNDLSNIQFKQAEYQAIMQQLSGQGITPVMISVKHIDSPYYRTE